LVLALLPHMGMRLLWLVSVARVLYSFETLELQARELELASREIVKLRAPLLPDDDDSILSILQQHASDSVSEVLWRHRPLQDEQPWHSLTSAVSRNGMAHAVLFLQTSRAAFQIELFGDVGLRVSKGLNIPELFSQHDQRQYRTYKQLRIANHVPFTILIEYVRHNAARNYSVASYNCQHFCFEVYDAFEIASVPDDSYSFLLKVSLLAVVLVGSALLLFWKSHPRKPEPGPPREPRMQQPFEMKKASWQPRTFLQLIPTGNADLWLHLDNPNPDMRVLLCELEAKVPMKVQTVLLDVGGNKCGETNLAVQVSSRKRYLVIPYSSSGVKAVLPDVECCFHLRVKGPWLQGVKWITIIPEVPLVLEDALRLARAEQKT
jgi:hypothetical protein